LALVLAIAVVVHETGFRRSFPAGLRAAFGGHRTLLALLVLAVAAVAMAGGSSSVLGNYAAVQHGGLLVAGTWSHGRELLDYVVVGIGVVPLVGAAAFVPGALVRPEGRAEHAYAVLMVGVVATLVLATGSFSARYAAGPN